MIAATTSSAVVPASNSLADSISVASNSSTATPRTMNTTKLSSRALTVRNNNAKASTPPTSSKSKIGVPPSTKRARTSDGVKGNSGGDSPSSDIVPVERRPLPSAR